jgi:hypothetical protein
MSKVKKRIQITLLTLASMLVVLIAGFYIYTLDYYRADTQAMEVFSSGITNSEKIGQMTVIYPEKQLNNQTGFIFYPGGKVEANAYMPLLEQLSERGITCILLEMPFNLADFDVKAADETYDQFPEIQQWYLGGHSLGGAMASSYAGEHFEKLDGLILMGAYPLNDADLPTIIVYGSEDEGLDKTKLVGEENILEIVGGNHAYFGNYGEQKGDGIATITREDQQAQAVEAIIAFIQAN